jgi:hypothetical protein
MTPKDGMQWTALSWCVYICRVSICTLKEPFFFPNVLSLKYKECHTTGEKSNQKLIFTGSLLGVLGKLEKANGSTLLLLLG